MTKNRITGQPGFESAARDAAIACCSINDSGFSDIFWSRSSRSFLLRSSHFSMASVSFATASAFAANSSAFFFSASVPSVI